MTYLRLNRHTRHFIKAGIEVRLCEELNSTAPWKPERIKVNLKFKVDIVVYQDLIVYCDSISASQIFSVAIRLR